MHNWQNTGWQRNAILNPPCQHSTDTEVRLVPPNWRLHVPTRLIYFNWRMPAVILRSVCTNTLALFNISNMLRLHFWHSVLRRPYIVAASLFYLGPAKSCVVIPDNFATNFRSWWRQRCGLWRGGMDKNLQLQQQTHVQRAGVLKVSVPHMRVLYLWSPL